MKLPPIAGIGAAALLWGCGGGPKIDAGLPDSGIDGGALVDAGSDGGPSSAGPDSGPSDAGWDGGYSPSESTRLFGIYTNFVPDAGTATPLEDGGCCVETELQNLMDIYLPKNSGNYVYGINGASGGSQSYFFPRYAGNRKALYVNHVDSLSIDLGEAVDSGANTVIYDLETSQLCRQCGDAGTCNLRDDGGCTFLEVDGGTTTCFKDWCDPVGYYNLVSATVKDAGFAFGFEPSDDLWVHYSDAGANDGGVAFDLRQLDWIVLPQTLAYAGGINASAIASVAASTHAIKAQASAAVVFAYVNLSQNWGNLCNAQTAVRAVIDAGVDGAHVVFIQGQYTGSGLNVFSNLGPLLQSFVFYPDGGC